eukprot:2249316-Rhodomonas_salina.2
MERVLLRGGCLLASVLFVTGSPSRTVGFSRGFCGACCSDGFPRRVQVGSGRRTPALPLAQGPGHACVQDSTQDRDHDGCSVAARCEDGRKGLGVREDVETLRRSPRTPSAATDA